MKFYIHKLWWYAQLLNWIFKFENVDSITKEVLLLRLKDHILTIVERYKDYVYGWEVVNAAINDWENVFYLPSVWYRICGD